MEKTLFTLIFLLEGNLSKDGEVKGTSNGKDDVTKEVKHVETGPCSNDPTGNNTEGSGNNERKDERRNKHRKSSGRLDGLKSKPVKSDAAGVDHSGGEKNDLERSNRMLSRKNKNPGETNKTTTNDRDEQFRKNNTPITLGNNTRDGLVALSDSNETHHTTSSSTTKSDGREARNRSLLPEINAKDSSEKEDSNEGQLSLSDAAAIVELHNKDLGTLPVDDNEAERSVNKAEVFISRRMEAKAMTDKER